MSRCRKSSPLESRRSKKQCIVAHSIDANLFFKPNKLLKQAGLIPIEFDSNLLLNCKWQPVQKTKTTWKFFYIESSLLCFQVTCEKPFQFIDKCYAFGQERLLSNISARYIEWTQCQQFSLDDIFTIVINYQTHPNKVTIASWKSWLTQKVLDHQATYDSKQKMCWKSAFVSDQCFLCCRVARQEATLHLKHTNDHNLHIDLQDNLAIEVSCAPHTYLFEVLSILIQQLEYHTLLHPKIVTQMTSQLVGMKMGRLRFIVSRRQIQVASVGYLLSFDAQNVWKDPDDDLMKYFHTRTIRDLIWDYVGYNLVASKCRLQCATIDQLQVHPVLEIHDFDSRFHVSSRDILDWQHSLFNDRNFHTHLVLETRTNRYDKVTSLDEFRTWFLEQLDVYSPSKVPLTITFRHHLFIPELSLRRPDLHLLHILVYNFIRPELTTYLPHNHDTRPNTSRTMFLQATNQRIGDFGSTGYLFERVQTLVGHKLIHYVEEPVLMQAILACVRFEPMLYDTLRDVRYGNFTSLQHLQTDNLDLFALAEAWVYGKLTDCTFKYVKVYNTV